jgi:hypothetical protein
MAAVDYFPKLDGVSAASVHSKHDVPFHSPAGQYVLATGAAAAYRLRILHRLRRNPYNIPFAARPPKGVFERLVARKRGEH